MMATQPSKSTHRRWFIWLPLLGLTAWLVLDAPEQEGSAIDDVVRPVVRTATPASRPGAPLNAHAGSDRGSRQTLIPRAILFPSDSRDAPQRDLFEAIDWTPAPPPAPQTAPTEPQAPALPFSYLGKQKAGSDWEVFLAKGETTFIVRQGQAFADSYRVDSIQPPQMTVTYLPLDQIQTLNIGAAQ